MRNSIHQPQKRTRVTCHGRETHTELNYNIGVAMEMKIPHKECFATGGGGERVVHCPSLRRRHHENKKERKKKNPFWAGEEWIAMDGPALGWCLVISHCPPCVCVCICIFPIPRDVVVHDQTRSIDTLYYYYILRCRHLLITWHSILPIFFFFFFHLGFFSSLSPIVRCTQRHQPRLTLATERRLCLS